uniref:Uncharacterized protein n=1 Tax=Amphimedon queenslandica TaxID=400682 RepID=A0A1X7UUA7_AMPQE
MPDIDLTISSPVPSACPSQFVTPPPSFQEPAIPACGQPITSFFQQPHNPVKQPIILQPFTPAQQPIIQQPITPVQQSITPLQQPVTFVQQPVTPVHQQITPVQQSLTSVQQLTAQSHFIHQPVTAPSGTPPLSDSPPPLPPPTCICNLPPTQRQSPVFQEPLLLDPDDVVRKYPKYRNTSQAGSPAVRLAIESYFGTEMLRQCTVYGLKESDGKPKSELQNGRNRKKGRGKGRKERIKHRIESLKMEKDECHHQSIALAGKNEELKRLRATVGRRQHLTSGLVSSVYQGGGATRQSAANPTNMKAEDKSILNKIHQFQEQE